MTFLSKWKDSLCALGGLCGYFEAYCRILSAWLVLAYALGAVAVLEGVAFFGGSSLPSLAIPLMAVSKVAGIAVLIWMIASILRFFDTKKRALAYYAQKAALWLILMAFISVTVVFALPFIIGKFPAHYNDWPRSWFYLSGFITLLYSAVVPAWTYTESSLLDAVKRSICFTFAELPALVLLMAPLWVASHYFMLCMMQNAAAVAPGVAPDPAFIIGIALYGQVMNFFGNAMIAHWYQKRSKKAATPKSC